MTVRAVPEKFLVAFSLAGEHRDLVRAIAESVEQALGPGTVFFDEWFEHYIAGSDADLKLRKIYTACALAVVCVPEDTGAKPWTTPAHAAIRSRLLKVHSSADDRDQFGILPIRVGDGDVHGLLLNTIVPDVRGRATEEAAELIVERVRLILGDSPPSGLARTDLTTAPKVFISYRREDAAGHAGRIADYLGHQLGPERIVMDLEVEVGGNPAKQVAAAVRACAVMLVIIGPSWVSARDHKWRRRLDDPDDRVRLEIAAAIQARIPTVPVLVGDAPFPSGDDFPEDIKALFRWQAVQLRDEDWKRDIMRLSEVVDRFAKLPAPSRREEGVQPKPPAAIAAPSTPKPAERVSVRPDAFISYAAEDRAWALALVSKLEQSGRRCWIAPRDIRAGTSYPKAITRAIKESRLMIVIVSAHASASEDVLGEVTLAKNNNVLRLPVRIDSSPLDEGLEYFFSQSQWFDAADLTQEEAVQRLNASIGVHLD